MVVYLAERGRRVFLPKGQRLSIADWEKQHGLDEVSTIDPADIKPIEKIIATPEMREKRQAQWRNNKRAAPLVGIFAVALLAGGIYQASDLARLESSGLRAQGEVERLVGESSSRGSYSYHGASVSTSTGIYTRVWLGANHHHFHINICARNGHLRFAELPS